MMKLFNGQYLCFVLLNVMLIANMVIKTTKLFPFFSSTLVVLLFHYRSRFLYSLKRSYCYGESRKCCNCTLLQGRAKKRVCLLRKWKEVRNFSYSIPEITFIHMEHAKTFTAVNISKYKCTYTLDIVLISQTYQRNSRPFFVVGKKPSSSCF